MLNAIQDSFQPRQRGLTVRHTVVGSPRRAQGEAFVANVFERQYAAEVDSFAPNLMLLENAERIVAVAGWRCAGNEKLFLESYLDVPVEVAVSRLAGRTILVEQLLRLARLDPLKGLEGATRIDLRSIVGEAAERLRNARPPLAQTLVESFPDGELISYGDANLVGIAVRNLLDNAARYSRPDSTVWLEISAAADGYTLVVRDNGPGVAAETLGRLGERFYRGRDNPAEGNGLGLAIVSRIAELHGACFIAGNLPAGGFVASLIGLPMAPSPLDSSQLAPPPSA